MDDVKNCSGAKFESIFVHVPLGQWGSQILRIVSRIAAFRDRYTSAALLSVCMSSLSITPYQLVKCKRLIYCHLQDERWFLEKIGHHD